MTKRLCVDLGVIPYEVFIMTKSEGDIDKKREIIDLDADEPLTEKRVNDGSPNGWSKKWWNNETKSSVCHMAVDQIVIMLRMVFMTIFRR